MEHTIELILIEDDSTLRDGFAQLLETSPRINVIGAYASAVEALRQLKEQNADVILLDIELPGISGIEAIPKIKQILPQVKIIMLTVYDTEEKVFQALQMGANGYLTKNSSSDKIKEAIIEVANGGAPMSMNIAKMVIQSFHKNMNSPLTKRESEILNLVALGKSRSKIASELFIDVDTVKTHIKNIYAKLDVHSKDEAIKEAKDNKYI